jgi:hypothetical protein
MHSAVLRCLNRFTFLDYFKFRGEARPKTGPEASVHGFVGSVMMVLIIVAYCINATLNFLQTPETVDVTHFPMQNQTANLVPTCFSVPFLNDETYFNYDFQQVNFDENGTKTVIPILRETSSTDSGEGSNKFCISPNATHAKLRSFCSPFDCSFVQFHLWTCGSSDPRSPTVNKSIACKSLKEIGNILQTNYVDVTYQTDLGDIVLHATPKINGACLFTTTFTYNVTTHHPDLLRTFTTTTHTNLVHDSDQYALTYFFKTGSIPNKPVLEVRMVFGASWVTTDASHRTSADLLSAFGAFAGVIQSVFALIFVMYNEKKFYAREENWARIKRDFTVLPHGEVYDEAAEERERAEEEKRRNAKTAKRTVSSGYSKNGDELGSVHDRESLSLIVQNVQQ